MSTRKLMAIDAVCQRGSIRDQDVALLRRAFAQDSHIGAGTVDALLRVQSMARIQSPTWANLFIDILTDYVVRELEPAGYVTAAHAGWLISRVSSAGRVRTRTEHDLLLNVIDKARWVPESLLAFAIAQIRDAVVGGDGPLRASGALEPGIITVAEVEQIRALLFAYGDDGPKAITQIEIDALFDIEAAVSANQGMGAPGIATWSDLFEKALASAALAASGYAGPTREEALRETMPLWAPDRPSDSHLTLVAGQSVQHILGHYRLLAQEMRALSRLELQRVEIITGEPVAVASAERLAARIHSNRPSMARARAVLETIGQADLSLHPALRTKPQAAIQAA